MVSNPGVFYKHRWDNLWDKINGDKDRETFWTILFLAVGIFFLLNDAYVRHFM